MHPIFKFDYFSPRSKTDYILEESAYLKRKGFVNVAATSEIHSKCMNGRKFHIFNTKTRPLEMVLIILQQQIYRNAKWIVNAANTSIPILYLL